VRGRVFSLGLVLGGALAFKLPDDSNETPLLKDAKQKQYYS
jgi:hypothetical protein